MATDQAAVNSELLTEFRITDSLLGSRSRREKGRKHSSQQVFLLLSENNTGDSKCQCPSAAVRHRLNFNISHFKMQLKFMLCQIRLRKTWNYLCNIKTKDSKQQGNIT